MPEAVLDRSIRDEDWYGKQLTGSAYTRCQFHHVDLTEAVSRSVVFTECTFDTVLFNASRHTDSAFLRCTFRRCNLFEAQFAGCKLIGSVFVECTLRPLTVTGGDWSFVGLSDADLRGVEVRGARMREVDLSGADCRQAAFTGADLSGAQLRGTKFGGCDLRGSDVSAIEPRSADLAGAVIDQVQAVLIARALGLEVRDPADEAGGGTAAGPRRPRKR
jgi:fluoroquinolone resistance protein